MMTNMIMKIRQILMINARKKSKYDKYLIEYCLINFIIFQLYFFFKYFKLKIYFNPARINYYQYLLIIKLLKVLL